jgi:hypothetical protein
MHRAYGSAFEIERNAIGPQSPIKIPLPKGWRMEMEILCDVGAKIAMYSRNHCSTKTHRPQPQNKKPLCQAKRF